MRASAALAEKLQTSLHFARLREPCSVEVNIRTKLFAQSTEVANSVNGQTQRHNPVNALYTLQNATIAVGAWALTADFPALAGGCKGIREEAVTDFRKEWLT